jgi:hypothetical protein
LAIAGGVYDAVEKSIAEIGFQTSESQVADKDRRLAVVIAKFEQFVDQKSFVVGEREASDFIQHKELRPLAHLKRGRRIVALVFGWGSAASDDFLAAVSCAERQRELSLANISRSVAFEFPNNAAGEPGFASANVSNKEREPLPVFVDLVNEFLADSETLSAFCCGCLEGVKWHCAKFLGEKRMGRLAGRTSQANLKKEFSRSLLWFVPFALGLARLNHFPVRWSHNPSGLRVDAAKTRLGTLLCYPFPESVLWGYPGSRCVPVLFVHKATLEIYQLLKHRQNSSTLCS